MQESKKITAVKDYFINKNHWLFLFLYVALVIFFIQVHPYVPYDGDDWGLSSRMRFAFPKWHAHNPIKVFPEELFPIAGYLAAYIINPILHDYIFSITVVNAFLYSGFIVFYIYMFSRLLDHFFLLKPYENIFVTFLFFLFHFIILKGRDGTSDYLFRGITLTCVYHYAIPAYLNFTLVFYLWRKLQKYSTRKIGICEAGIFFFGLYLALFSNVQHSIIIASFLGGLIISKYGKDLCSPIQWKNIILQNRFISGTIFVWLISLIFETNGENAATLGHSIQILQLKKVIDILIHNVKFNQIFLIVSILSVIMGFGCLYKEKLGKKATVERKNLFEILKISIPAFFLTLVYLILVEAKAIPWYISRGDVLISMLGWILMVICAFIAYVLKENPKIFMIAPVVTLIVLCEAMNPRSPYKEATTNYVLPKTAYALDNDFLNQIIEADQAGKKEMTLYVPVGNKKDNWPHPFYMGYNISSKLFNEGIISKRIEIGNVHIMV